MLYLKKITEEIKHLENELLELTLLGSIDYSHISGNGISDVTCNRSVKILELKMRLERLKEQYYTLMGRLSDNEKRVIEYSLKGYTKRDIACAMCYSTDNIYKIYNVAINKLQY